MSELAGRFWDRFGTLAIGDVPAEVAEVAAHSIMDWFGCALAGSREPLSAILRAEFASSREQHTLIGSPERADRLRAALINGAAGHALDFDDSSAVMGGHPSAPVVPALLALCESGGRTGAELLTAYVVGSEIQARVGTGIGPEHYAKGWHTTSTIGVFGAAAGCSRLLGLDADRFGHAMGLAASGAAGLKANFGTMAKPLHPGAAAERGLLAARLAARGYTANPAAIDGNQGLAQAAGTGDLDQSRINRWADDWTVLRTVFKFHAACHFTHAGIEATSLLLHQGLEARDVEQITLRVNPSILDVCGIASPTTGLEAKFSLRGTQALLINGFDTAAAATFEDGPINRQDVQAFIPRVVVEPDESLHAMATAVNAQTMRGEQRATHDASRPSTDLTEQATRLRKKFDAQATPVLGQQKTSELRDRLAALVAVPDIDELLVLTR